MAVNVDEADSPETSTGFYLPTHCHAPHHTTPIVMVFFISNSNLNATYFSKDLFFGAETFMVSGMFLPTPRNENDIFPGTFISFRQILQCRGGGGAWVLGGQ